MAQNWTENEMKANRLVIFILIGLLAIAGSGCGMVGGFFDSVTNAVGANDTGTVIASRAQIRSSYAVVAADLLEVKRGMTMNILEEIEFERVKWYRVRASDEDQTEGWIEAQNVIMGSLLDKSRKIAAEDKGLAPQAEGDLRASTNLRLTPEQRDDNIILKLEKKGDNDTSFHIMGWKYVPKADTSDVDDSSKNKANRPRTKNEEVEAAKEENKPLVMDEKYDIWYKVRLDPSVSPAPAGWIFGRQVELQLPTDIAIYQKESNRMVSWQRLDGAETEEKVSKDNIKVAKPGSWVILLRSNVVKSTDGNEPTFDSILVLGYDKYDQSHYAVCRVENANGDIPLRIGGSGDNKSFTVNIRNAAGGSEEKQFVLFRDAKGKLKINTPPDLPCKK
jgi:hypothetical protein